jgi:tetratricopeptide (TPR) repeat protein
MFGALAASTTLFAVLGLAGQTPAPLPDPLFAVRSLLADNQLAQATEALHIYIAEHPSSADAHFLLGYVLFREQKAKDSLAEFTEGAKHRRPRAEELKTVASDYVLLADYSDADQWFSQVTVETPNDANAWYLLGRTRYDENFFDPAVTAFRRALELHPQYIEAENNLGLCLKELDKTNEAKAAFLAAIDWQGRTPLDAQPFLNLGSLLADEGDLEKAIPYLVQAVAIAPNNPKTHEELGTAYQSQNLLPKAQAELERAVALAPDSSGLHFKLGQLYRKQGAMAPARREFEICERLNSTHSSNATPNPYLPVLPAPH